MVGNAIQEQTFVIGWHQANGVIRDVFCTVLVKFAFVCTVCTVDTNTQGDQASLTLFTEGRG
jgi:hypothetical protein